MTTIFHKIRNNHKALNYFFMYKDTRQNLEMFNQKKCLIEWKKFIFWKKRAV